MGLIRFVVKIMIFVVSFISVLFLLFATWFVSSGGSDNGVHLIPKEGANNVEYKDAIPFVLETWRTIAQPEPDYIVRGWINARWWRDGTLWLDTGITYVKDGFASAILPVYTMNDINRYTLVGYNDEQYRAEYFNRNQEEYEVYYGKDYSEKAEDDMVLPEKSGALKALDAKLQRFNAKNSEGELIYAKWHAKFIENGELKSAAILLYYQIFAAAVIALYITHILADTFTKKLFTVDENPRPRRRMFRKGNKE